MVDRIVVVGITALVVVERFVLSGPTVLMDTSSGSLQAPKSKIKQRITRVFHTIYNPLIEKSFYLILVTFKYVEPESIATPSSTSA